MANDFEGIEDLNNDKEAGGEPKGDLPLDNLTDSKEVEFGEKELDKPEILPQDKEFEEIKEDDGRIGKISASVEDTEGKLEELRKELDLPISEEEAPSVSIEREKLEHLREKEKIEKQKLIQEEKEKIIQEKISEIAEEFESIFESLEQAEIESIVATGLKRNRKKVESVSMGTLDSGTAKVLARAFKEGVKFLPKLLEVAPYIIKKFDEDLTREAEERVNQRLKEMSEETEKTEVKPESEEESQKPTEKIEKPAGEEEPIEADKTIPFVENPLSSEVDIDTETDIQK